MNPLSINEGQKMIDERFVDKIVARVLALLNGEPIDSSPRRVMMLFSGASTGFVVGTEAIRRLVDSGHNLTVLLTPSAVQIITEAKIRQAGATEIILPGTWVNAPGLVKQSELVLVPTLSMNLAARLALGLMDSLISTLVIGSLLAGKPVVAVQDGADPNGNAGLVFGAGGKAAPALRAKLAGHLNTLTSYGIELVNEEDFLMTVERRLLTGAVVQPSNGSRKPQSGFGRSSGARAGETVPGGNGQTNFVTEAELLTCPPGSVLRLASGSRLTPLAHDTAKRLNLQLLFE